MSLTIQQQILDEIGARLALIDTVSGYHTTAMKIERARLTPFKDYDLPAINYWPDLDQRRGGGGGFEERSLTVLIEIHDKTRDRPFSDVAGELASDVWIALWRATTAGSVSDQPSSALGGLVTSIQLNAVQPEIGEGQSPFCGALLNITTIYKRRPDAPFTIVA